MTYNTLYSGPTKLSKGKYGKNEMNLFIFKIFMPYILVWFDANEKINKYTDPGQRIL